MAQHMQDEWALALVLAGLALTSLASVATLLNITALSNLLLGLSNALAAPAAAIGSVWYIANRWRRR